MSALCRALAPEQVQVTYCAGDAHPFRVEWEGDFGTVSFAGQTPDDAAERALVSLSGRAAPRARQRRGASPPAPPGTLDPASESLAPSHNSLAPEALAPSSGSLAPEALPSCSGSLAPDAQVDWAEAMRERIEQIEARVQVRRPRLRLVR